MQKIIDDFCMYKEVLGGCMGMFWDTGVTICDGFNRMNDFMQSNLITKGELLC